MGDMNAKTGSDNTDRERAVGREGCGIINDNGEKFVNFCFNNNCVIVVVYPLPWPLLVGGESDVSACGPPASFSVHLASSAVTPAGSVHKSRGDNVVRMWVQLKR